MAKGDWFYKNYMSKTIPEDLNGLSEAEKQHLIDQWGEAIHTQNVQSRDDKLQSIRDLRRIHLRGAPVWVMDRFKEMIDHYVCGQWLSSIALAGIIAEFLSFHLMEEYVKSNGIRGLIRYSGKLGNQKQRLKTLRKLGVLTEKEREELDLVRRTRNEYLHLDRIAKSGRKIKPASLDVVTNLTSFLNEHKLPEN